MCVYSRKQREVYSRQIAIDRCNQFDISRKQSSKEVYDVFSAGSILLPPPLGVFEVPIFQLININESRFYLKKCVLNYGRGHSSCRVRIPTYYKRKESKINLMMAIEPGNS